MMGPESIGSGDVDNKAEHVEAAAPEPKINFDEHGNPILEAVSISEAGAASQEGSMSRPEFNAALEVAQSLDDIAEAITAFAGEGGEFESDSGAGGLGAKRAIDAIRGGYGGNISDAAVQRAVMRVESTTVTEKEPSAVADEQASETELLGEDTSMPQETESQFNESAFFNEVRGHEPSAIAEMAAGVTAEHPELLSNKSFIAKLAATGALRNALSMAGPGLVDSDLSRMIGAELGTMGGSKYFDSFDVIDAVKAEAERRGVAY